MREQMEQRLEELKGEYEAGQKMLADLEQKKMALEQTMLRISGAIQVLEEMLAPAPPVPAAQIPGGEIRAAAPNGQV
jgi:prefoldin subunit 5